MLEPDDDIVEGLEDKAELRKGGLRRGNSVTECSSMWP